jgi:CelD/BcsL family acetyltransferase involved in cellulose biosynthesis
MQVSEYSWTQWPEIAEEWRALHAVSPEASAFTSAAWTSAWFQVFGPILKPKIYTLTSNGAVRAAWILVRRTDPWHGVPLRRVYFGTAGEDEADSPCIEHNGLVCQPDFRDEALRAIQTTFAESRWDELMLHGVTPGFAEALSAGRQTAMRVAPVYGVDLELVTQTGKPYLESLSYNTRKQIRRSRRFYEKRGPLSVDVAQTPDEGLTMLDQLAVLHQAAWQEKGKPGVFSSKIFCDFHRYLISNHFDSVQLVRVRAGETEVGLLYSLVSNGVAYTYQSGFQYEESNDARPGMVVTSLAIEYGLDHGIHYFDLTAGESQYKRSLSTSRRELAWASARSGTLRARLRQWADSRKPAPQPPEPSAEPEPVTAPESGG